MQLTVKIECETIEELQDHFAKLRRQVKSLSIKRKYNPPVHSLKTKDGGFLYHSADYGTHSVDIKNKLK